MSLLVAAVASTASAQPSATKIFSPDVIGPGSVTTLTIVITNPELSVPATGLAITDPLPTGMTIATPSFASTTCSDAVLTAPQGGSTISLSGGRLGAGGSCTISVDVTVGLAGSFVNTTGDVTSSAGNGGSATDTLTADANLPGFSLGFSPGTIPLGGTSTLTFTIDSTLLTGFQILNFLNDLPEGLVVADPANASSDCALTPPTIDADPGTSVIAFNGAVNAPSICTVNVDVTATTPRALANRTGLLAASAGTSGRASGVLAVTSDALNLGAFFSGDPVQPGGSLQLDFTINNFSREGAATSIEFTNDLGAALSGLVAVGLPISNLCGAGSELSGTSLLSFTGGTLASGESCEFSVTLEVPLDAMPGTYTNTTSMITANIDGAPQSGGPISDDFQVAFVPILEKSFGADPVGAGQTVDLEFTITNSSASLAATDIAFTDNLSDFIPGLVAMDLPAADVCGSGSSLALMSFGTDESGISLTGGSLLAGGSCTFNVTLQIPVDAVGGRFTNTTSRTTATVGDAVSGPPATADLSVVPAPTLRKSFVEDRVAPGSQVILEFSLLHLGEDLPGNATDIAFTDDLDAMLAGVVATDLPKADVCGPGSQLSGTSMLALTGGSLERDTECTFSVTLEVPSDPPPGIYNNQTTNVTAVVAGLMVTGNVAEDSLEVSNLSFVKEFVDDPVVAGTTTTLEFTITNEDRVLDATGISFTDALDDVLPGLTAVGLPANDVCGVGSQLVLGVGSTITLMGGDLGPQSSCTFGVTVQTPPDAEADEYINVTSNLFATIGGVGAVLSPATDTLEIIDALTITKAFDRDVVVPGDNVTLEFTIENAHPDEMAVNLSFTDDLDAALMGLVNVFLPLGDVCGSGSELSGTDVITLTGGTLAAQSSCTFSVTLQVPSDVAPGSVVENVTSQLSGEIGGMVTTADPAIDELAIALTTLSKAFGGSAEPTAMTTLTFTIENLNATAPMTDIGFADDLDAVLSGLVAIDSPMSDVCGPGSELEGDSVLTLRGGELLGDASCTFSVTVEVPETAAPGDYQNTTTEVSSGGITVGDAATAILTVDESPPGDGDGGGGCGCRTTRANTSVWWLLGAFAFGWFFLRRR